MQLVVLKKLRVVVLKKLRAVALKKRNPAAREKLVRLRLPILVVAGKRALGPYREQLLQSIIGCLQSGIYEIKTDKH